VNICNSQIGLKGYSAVRFQGVLDSTSYPASVDLRYPPVGYRSVYWEGVEFSMRQNTGAWWCRADSRDYGCDAGCLGLGDVEHYFPHRSLRAGADSLVLLGKLHPAGSGSKAGRWNIDSVGCGRRRNWNRISAMRDLMPCLAVIDQIGIKATTNETGPVDGKRNRRLCRRLAFENKLWTAADFIDKAGLTRLIYSWWGKRLYAAVAKDFKKAKLIFELLIKKTRWDEISISN